jgi:septum formation protein
MNRPPILNIPILLASASPRRKYLLEEAGFTIRVIPPDVDEEYSDLYVPTDIPVLLAKRKATALANSRMEQEVILAADSVVILDNDILGKPRDNIHAIKMLRKLSGRTHQVITGVCLLAADKESVFHCISEVTFSILTDVEIQHYIDHYRPFDKAGSYGVQEWLGWCRIKSIHGSYSNIMGLPVEMVYDELTSFVS